MFLAECKKEKKNVSAGRVDVGGLLGGEFHLLFFVAEATIG